MQKALLLLFIISTSFVYAQNEETYEVQDASTYEENGYYTPDEYSFANDTLTYNKTTELSEKRQFQSDLNEKYNGKDFTYIDDLKKEEKKPTADIDTSGADLFLSFMANIFPYLIALIVVFIILKTFVNTEAGFWKFGKISKKTTEKLVHDDHENIDETDFDALLKKAIQHGDFRLATRYYYLSSLKKLSQKELIKYDKDKTNTEYQFELQNKELRHKFSYVAYIYDYVWYGEFPVDQVKFNVIENKYKSFMQVI